VSVAFLTAPVTHQDQGFHR